MIFRAKRSKSKRKSLNSKRNRRSQQNQSKNLNENKTPLTNQQIDFDGEGEPNSMESKKLTFHCQLAHGSPTGIIKGFNSLKQLYQTIADCYDGVDADDIIFCTLNTHKISMDEHLLGGSIVANDFIFAHIKGQTKEVVITKTQSALGLTISDNGAGKAFIKRIKPNSICFNSHPAIQVGDYIEKIDSESMNGKRHFDVANALRQIAIGQTFTLRVIEPIKSAFDFVNGNTQKSMKPQIDSGFKTIRFRTDGKAVIKETADCPIKNEINEIFDTYLGFHDEELAEAVWEIGVKCSRITEMEQRIKESEIARFDFPIELLFDIWGAINDWNKNNDLLSNTATMKPMR